VSEIKPKLISDIIEELQDSVTLREWEETFVNDIADKWFNGDTLSVRQKNKLVEIYNQDLTRK
jgi:hypothetical protein